MSCVGIFLPNIGPALARLSDGLFTLEQAWVDAVLAPGAVLVALSLCFRVVWVLGLACGFHPSS